MDLGLNEEDPLAEPHLHLQHPPGPLHDPIIPHHSADNRIDHLG